MPGAKGVYLVVGLDLDAPFVSLPVLGPILHWVQSGLVAGADGVLEAKAPFTANYIGPAPPPGAAPHRYVFLLYEQPAGYDVAKYAPADGKKLGNAKRMFYRLENLEKEIKLGPVIAANYFKSN